GLSAGIPLGLRQKRQRPLATAEALSFELPPSAKAWHTTAPTHLLAEIFGSIRIFASELVQTLKSQRTKKLLRILFCGCLDKKPWLFVHVNCGGWNPALPF